MNLQRIILASCALLAASLCVGAAEYDGDALRARHLEVVGCSTQSGIGSWVVCDFKSTRQQPITLADLDAVCSRDNVASQLPASESARELPGSPDIGLVCKGDAQTAIRSDIQ